MSFLFVVYLLIFLIAFFIVFKTRYLDAIYCKNDISSFIIKKYFLKGELLFS